MTIENGGSGRVETPGFHRSGSENGEIASVPSTIIKHKVHSSQQSSPIQSEHMESSQPVEDADLEDGEMVDPVETAETPIAIHIPPPPTTAAPKEHPVDINKDARKYASTELEIPSPPSEWLDLFPRAPSPYVPDLSTSISKFMSTQTLKDGSLMYIPQSLKDSFEGYRGTAEITDYQTAKKVGEGTFGEVTIATHKATGRKVALKKIILHKDRDGLPITAIREIAVLKSQTHPNLIALEEIAVLRGDRKADESATLFMVFPYMEHDLSGLLDNHQVTLSAAHIKSFMRQMLEGLSYLHEHDVIHRDMKSANILVDKTGSLKIADFGLARYITADDDQRLTPTVVTLWYRAPELLLGKQNYTTAVDMWGVGCIFAEMFERRPLFKGGTEMDLLEKIFNICGTSELCIINPDNPSGGKFPRLDDGTLTPTLMPRRLRESLGEEKLDFATLSLVDNLLQCDPDRRPTAAEALRSEYFRVEPAAAIPGTLDFPDWPESHEYGMRQRHEQAARDYSQRASLSRMIPGMAPLENRPPQLPEHSDAFRLRNGKICRRRRLDRVDQFWADEYSQYHGLRKEFEGRLAAKRLRRMPQPPTKATYTNSSSYPQHDRPPVPSHSSYRTPSKPPSLPPPPPLPVPTSHRREVSYYDLDAVTEDYTPLSRNSRPPPPAEPTPSKSRPVSKPPVDSLPPSLDVPVIKTTSPPRRSSLAPSEKSRTSISPQRPKRGSFDGDRYIPSDRPRRRSRSPLIDRYTPYDRRRRSRSRSRSRDRGRERDSYRVRDQSRDRSRSRRTGRGHSRDDHRPGDNDRRLCRASTSESHTRSSPKRPASSGSHTTTTTTSKPTQKPTSPSRPSEKNPSSPPPKSVVQRPSSPVKRPKVEPSSPVKRPSSSSPPKDIKVEQHPSSPKKPITKEEAATVKTEQTFPTQKRSRDADAHHHQEISFLPKKRSRDAADNHQEISFLPKKRSQASTTTSPSRVKTESSTLDEEPEDGELKEEEDMDIDITTTTTSTSPTIHQSTKSKELPSPIRPPPPPPKPQQPQNSSRDMTAQSDDLRTRINNSRRASQSGGDISPKRQKSPGVMKRKGGGGRYKR
ncbi:hypothetical protein DFS34DRAFT_604123 [Phlyctochytrium arcticum]|nr:hypothetical protein DFS34DRAFT_604123 [Phlyctochytrium arcticum]